MALCLPGPVVRMVINYKALSEWRQNPAQFYSRYTWPGAAEDFRDVLRVVDYLKIHPARTNGVYVWGNEPLIYYLSGHQPPTRFVWDLPLLAPWRLPGWRQQMMQQLSESRPRFVVVARDDEVHNLSYTSQDSEEAIRTFPEFAGFLRSAYRPCKDYPTFEIPCRSDDKPKPLQLPDTSSLRRGLQDGYSWIQQKEHRQQQQREHRHREAGKKPPLPVEESDFVFARAGMNGTKQ